MFINLHTLQKDFCKDNSYTGRQLMSSDCQDTTALTQYY